MCIRDSTRMVNISKMLDEERIRTMTKLYQSTKTRNKKKIKNEKLVIVQTIAQECSKVNGIQSEFFVFRFAHMNFLGKETFSQKLFNLFC